MSLRKICFLSLLLIPVFLFSGGQTEISQENRIVYDIDNFNSIDGSAAFDIEVRQSDRFSLIVYADKSTAAKMLVEKRGRTLVLGMKPFSGPGWNKSPKAVITMPELVSVEMSGASSMIAAGFRSDRSFSVDISGASSLEIDITASSADLEMSGASNLKAVLEVPEVRLEISGSSDLELVGRGGRLKAKISGASSGDLSDFKLSEASIDLSGSSDLTIRLDGKLDLDASGASKLYYSGDVNLGSIELSGASSLKER
ncbi:head GIN domain-containing protein [Spirochaeta isovalerica]|uniref:Putative auto-transporter adhesin head GIN domain-containing protein n=1 Tax=Spirochaeta isovalerica TaxID=150 RepID=A0A841R0A9_9SPIO|nr:head GIN domain-containing protein [Spirochaeta isovalerica]MBB6478374.1 hypothetical protein [Spirochaeta isovalerica]